MQFDLFEAMTALSSAVETALPDGRLFAGAKTAPPVLPPADEKNIWLSEELETLTGAEAFAAMQGDSSPGELRALSDRLELESLRYIRFLDMGVHA